MISDVAIEATASPHEAAALEEVFARAGFEVDAKPAIVRRSVDLLPWAVYVTVAAPIVAFFQSFASEAGKDAYAAVKAWAKDVWETRRGSVAARDQSASTRKT